MKLCVFGSVFLISATVSFALPTLQLDIPGGVYNAADQTTYSTGSSFNLVALLSGPLDPSRTYYISAAIEPKLSQSSPPPYGSFQMNSSVFSVANMHYGTPPVNVTAGKTLPTHDEFPTYFAEYSFKFDPTQTVAAYDVQTGASAAGTLYAYTLSVQTSPLLAGFSLHFDLYDETIDKKGNLTIDEFAPFSHDAQSGTNTTTTTQTVPDNGTTLLLFGAALCGLALVPKMRLARSKARR